MLICYNYSDFLIIFCAVTMSAYGSKIILVLVTLKKLFGIRLDIDLKIIMKMKTGMDFDVTFINFFPDVVKKVKFPTDSLQNEP